MKNNDEIEYEVLKLRLQVEQLEHRLEEYEEKLRQDKIQTQYQLTKDAQAKRIMGGKK